MELLLFLSVLSIVGYVVVKKIHNGLFLFIRQVFHVDLFIKVVIEFYRAFVVARPLYRDELEESKAPSDPQIVVHIDGFLP